MNKSKIRSSDNENKIYQKNYGCRRSLNLNYSEIKLMNRFKSKPKNKMIT